MTSKRNNSFCTPCIKISWEDIENIVEIMGAGTKIYNDGYEYNSKEELEQKIKNSKTKLKELHFINNSPYISLDLKHGRMLERGRGGGRICASKDAEVKFSKLKDFLIRKERSFSFLSGHWISLLGSLALGLSIEYTWNIDNHFYLLIIIPLIVTFAPFAFDAGYFTSIDLVHSDDKPKSFWSKNRNQIIITIIAGIIGIVIGIKMRVFF